MILDVVQADPRAQVAALAGSHPGAQSVGSPRLRAAIDSDFSRTGLVTSGCFKSQRFTPLVRDTLVDGPTRRQVPALGAPLEGGIADLVFAQGLSGRRFE